MGPSGQTRLQRARADWGGFSGGRDLINSIIGALLAAAVLFIAGFPHDAGVTILTIACTAVVGAFVFPAAELWWCWYRAPKRLQQAQKERIEQLEGEVAAANDAHVQSQTELRKLLIDYKRQAEEMYAAWGPSPSVPAAKQWTSEVVESLKKYGTVEQLEKFTGAGTGEAAKRVQSRKRVLEEILTSMEADEPSPSSRV